MTDRGRDDRERSPRGTPRTSLSPGALGRTTSAPPATVGAAPYRVVSFGPSQELSFSTSSGSSPPQVQSQSITGTSSHHQSSSSSSSVAPSANAQLPPPAAGAIQGATPTTTAVTTQALPLQPQPLVHGPTSGPQHQLDGGPSSRAWDGRGAAAHQQAAPPYPTLHQHNTQNNTQHNSSQYNQHNVNNYVDQSQRLEILQQHLQVALVSQDPQVISEAWRAIDAARRETETVRQQAAQAMTLSLIHI